MIAAESKQETHESVGNPIRNNSSAMLCLATVQAKGLARSRKNHAPLFFVAKQTALCPETHA